MRRLERWKEQAKYWKTVPASSHAMILGGIFCLFAAFGLVINMMNASKTGFNQALLWALLTGGFSAALALAAFRRMIKVMVPLILLQIAAQMALGRLGRHVPALSASVPDHKELLHRLQGEGVLAVLMICAGYALVLGFIQKEGRRVFGSLTEVRLAHEVHQTLVPAISHKIGEY